MGSTMGWLWRPRSRPRSRSADRIFSRATKRCRPWKQGSKASRPPWKGEQGGGCPHRVGNSSQSHLQPVPTGGGHGPILRNDTQGAQAVAGPQLGVSRAVRWSHLHCPWGSRAREHGGRPGVGFPSRPMPPALPPLCLPFVTPPPRQLHTGSRLSSSSRPPSPAPGFPVALTRAHVRLDGRVCDEREKLPCQGVTKVSPM